MISLIIAGGVYVAATAQTVTWPDINNHTLKGQPIPASQVVCRTMWGTPMLPDGKGGYSLIAPINEAYITQSLIQPPGDPRGMVAYRPLPAINIQLQETPVITETETTVTAPAPMAPAPAAPVDAAPVDNSVAPTQ